MTGTTPEPDSVGARPIGATSTKGPAAWIVPLAVLVLIALILLLLLSRCGSDDDPAAAGATDSPTASATTVTAATTNPGDSAAPAAGGSTAAGIVRTTDGKTLLPLSDSGGQELSSFAGTDATTTSVPVQSVPADEGFWVGTDESDRLWVQLTGKAGESPFEIKAGESVSFTGTVTKNPAGFADKVGVSAAEGAGQLTREGAHVFVPRAKLTLAP